MKPTLLILAAGMGSRFGGLKQIAPVGPNGETIIEYSIYDAIRAGFGKVVFVVRESFADEFKQMIESKLQGKIEVEFVYQELDKLPEGFELPEDREKPWGTGHAILMAKDVINEPFAMINADDFYGYEAYQAMASFLTSSADESEYSMVGYLVKNTLSENGSVSRGICKSDANNYLVEISETHNIVGKGNTICFTDDAEKCHELDENTLVSMNFWGFKKNLFDHLDDLFVAFLKENIHLLKSEFYITYVVYDLIQANQIRLKVLKADSPWCGVTYKEDKPMVVDKISGLIDDGVYPMHLWK